MLSDFYKCLILTLDKSVISLFTSQLKRVALLGNIVKYY